MSLNNSNQDQTIKNIGVIFLSMIILALISKLLAGNGFGNNLGGYGQGFGVTGLIVVLVNSLSLLAVVFIIAGLLFVIHKQNLNLDFLYQLFGGVHHERQFCSHCGTKIEKDWNHCPVCALNLKRDSSDTITTMDISSKTAAAVEDGIQSNIEAANEVEITTEVITETTANVITEVLLEETTEYRNPTTVHFNDKQDKPQTVVRQDKANNSKKKGQRLNKK